MIIRRAHLSDCARLVEVAAATFPLACPPGTPRSDIDAFIADQLGTPSFTDYLTRDDAHIVVCAAGIRVVGYSLVLTKHAGAPDPSFGVQGHQTGYVSKFYLSPSLHGTGTAKRLMAATVSNARGHGADSLWLAVNQHNVRAHQFYLRCGFTPVGTKTMQVGHGLHCDHVMQYHPTTEPGL